jgi:hypothetical protein
MGSFGTSPWRQSALRILITVAGSVGFSALIALIWSGDAFLQTALAAFLVFHGGTSPVLLMAESEAQKPLRQYVAAYATNLLVTMLPTTIAYRVIYGPLILYSYDYFVGLVLYLIMGTVMIISGRVRRSTKFSR